MAHLLRTFGLGPGGHVAVLLENRPEFFEVVWGALRSGLYVTPINWHLAPDEAAYIVEDCGATALVASAALGDGWEARGGGALAGRLAVGATSPASGATRRRSPPSRRRARRASARATGCSTRRAPPGGPRA